MGGEGAVSSFPPISFAKEKVVGSPKLLFTRLVWGFSHTWGSWKHDCLI